MLTFSDQFEFLRYEIFAFSATGGIIFTLIAVGPDSHCALIRCHHE